MAESCCGESVSAYYIINQHLMLRFSIIYANTLTDPARYDVFYLEYLETSLVRYTWEMQDFVGPVNADFTIPSMACR